MCYLNVCTCGVLATARHFWNTDAKKSEIAAAKLSMVIPSLRCSAFNFLGLLHPRYDSRAGTRMCVARDCQKTVKLLKTPVSNEWPWQGNVGSPTHMNTDL